MQELEVIETDLASQKDALKHKQRQLAALKLNPIDPKMSESVRPGEQSQTPFESIHVYRLREDIRPNRYLTRHH